MAAKRPQLKVEKREVLGKKIKDLRKQGILPANVYGKDFKSTAVQLPVKEFKGVYKEVHETGLVDLAVDSQIFPVLIKNVHVDPRSREPLHADFHKVNLKQKITAKIPVEVVGEARAVVDGLGVLLHPLSEIEVEALPTELPEKIEVSVEGLSEVGAQIMVSQLSVQPEVTVLTPGDQIVFKIGELAKEEPEPQVEAPAEGEEAAAEGPQGEKQAETAAEGGEKSQKPAEKEKASEAEDKSA